MALTDDGRRETSIPVLIVGVGPAGLMTALLHARHGLRSVVAERHPGTSILPRAAGINVRTMEILRGLGLGLEPALRAVEVDVRGLLVVTDLETLPGPVLHTAPNLNLRGPEDPAWPSPTRQGFCGQDVLEALLVDRIRDSAAVEIWFDTELVGFGQDGSAVWAGLRGRTSDAFRTVRAEYLVAAGGAHSRIRDRLGIAMTGHDHMSDEINILFDADLSPALAGKRSIVFRLRNSWLPRGGILRSNDGARRWKLIAPDPGDMTSARLVQIIRGCAGDSLLEVEILATGRWVKAATLGSDSIWTRLPGRRRRTPPGAGRRDGNEHRDPGRAQPGLEDRRRRQWIGGSGLPRLVRTERLPVAASAVEVSYRNEVDGNHARPILGLMLEATYDSAAVVSDGTPSPESPDPIAVYVPAARPGHRAPHCWLSSRVAASRPSICSTGVS